MSALAISPPLAHPAAHVRIETPPGQQPVPAGGTRSLRDLLHDGFYMVSLLRGGHLPSNAEVLRDRLKAFLGAFDRRCRQLGTSAGDARLAQFAFCALVDETVLAADPSLHEAWVRRPLQLELFGEQLAGERFFDHLETLRLEGAPRLQVLEVFHACLLLGFQGRYLLEGAEKLDYLTARLGDEIAHLRGSRPAFAPHWEAPDRPTHRLRREVPLWAVGSAVGLAALLGFAGLRAVLERQTQTDLAPYAGIVNLAPPPAHVTITLP